MFGGNVRNAIENGRQVFIIGILKTQAVLIAESQRERKNVKEF